MTHTIYQLTTPCGKKYIGQTKLTITRREQCHISALRHNKHPNPHLQKSFNNTGIKPTSKVLIFCETQDLANEAEEFLVSWLGAECNMTPGGKQNDTARTKTPEALEKLRTTYASEEYRTAQSDRSKKSWAGGRTVTPAMKEARKNLVVKMQTEEWRKLASERTKANKSYLHMHTPAARAAALAARGLSLKTKAVISDEGIVYISARAAEEALGIPKGHVCTAINRGGKAKGRTFRYV